MSGDGGLSSGRGLIRCAIRPRGAQSGASCVPQPGFAVPQAMVGRLGELFTRRYTHISDSAARAVVEKRDRNRSTFVDVFVDTIPI
jgi:hypothetical protein